MFAVPPTPRARPRRAADTPLPQLFSPFEIVRYDVTEGAPVRDAAGHCIRVGTGEEQDGDGGELGGPRGPRPVSRVPHPCR